MGGGRIGCGCADVTLCTCVCVWISMDFRCVYKLHKVQSQYSSHDMFVVVRVWYIIFCILNMFSYYHPGF